MGGATQACAPLPEGRHVDLVGPRQRRPRVRATAASEEDCDGNEPMWSRAMCRSEACRGIVHRCHAMESSASLRPSCTQCFPIRAWLCAALASLSFSIVEAMNIIDNK